VSFGARWYKVVKGRTYIHANYRNPLLRSYKRILVTTPAETPGLPISFTGQRKLLSVCPYVSGFVSLATITLTIVHVT